METMTSQQTVASPISSPSGISAVLSSIGSFLGLTRAKSRSSTDEQSTDTVLFEIYGDNKSVNLCKSSITQMIKDLCTKLILEDHMITTLGSEDIRHIGDISRKHGVDIKIDTKNGSLSLSGVKSYVNEAHVKIMKALVNQKGKNVDEVKASMSPSEFLVYLSKENVAIPSHWSSYYKNPSVPVTWLKDVVSTSDFHLSDVDKQCHSSICDIINQTWRSDLVGTGKDAAGLNPAIKSIQITRIQKVENPGLYQLYSNDRKSLLKRASTGDVVSIPSLTMPGSNVTSVKELQTKGISQQLDGSIGPDQINEYFLFHGTKANLINTILVNGFDPRIVKDEGMFGRGMYFAESSTKADQYCDEKGNRSAPGTDLKFFVVRVLLGKPFVTDKVPEDKLKRPPCTQCFDHKCTQHNSFFDSLMSETKNIFREFVVYERGRAYPEFVVTYKRI